MSSKIREVLAIIVLIGGILLSSWLICCAIIKAIFLCFGWAFSLKVATGIWLCIFLFNIAITRQGGD